MRPLVTTLYHPSVTRWRREWRLSPVFCNLRNFRTPDVVQMWMLRPNLYDDILSVRRIWPLATSDMVCAGHLVSGSVQEEMIAPRHHCSPMSPSSDVFEPPTVFLHTSVCSLAVPLVGMHSYLCCVPFYQIPTWTIIFWYLFTALVGQILELLHLDDHLRMCSSSSNYCRASSVRRSHAPLAGPTHHRQLPLTMGASHSPLVGSTHH